MKQWRNEEKLKLITNFGAKAKITLSHVKL
jgi:hypothetical protein